MAKLVMIIGVCLTLWGMYEYHIMILSQFFRPCQIAHFCTSSFGELFVVWVFGEMLICIVGIFATAIVAGITGNLRH